MASRQKPALAVEDGAVRDHHAYHVATRPHSGGVERPRIAWSGRGVDEARVRARHADTRRIGRGLDAEAIAADVAVARDEVAREHRAGAELAAVARAARDRDRDLGCGVVELHD